jgi:ubiquitin carboxyl-terminal hydrolase L3
VVLPFLLDHSHQLTRHSENNPEVMNHLAYKLGLSRDLAFYDVYSLHDPSLLAFIPRPAYALLAIIPMTKAWKNSREAEDGPLEMYSKAGLEEPVVWFKQTIGHACGSIGLLHCVCNGPAVDMITPGSDLEKLLKAAVPLKMADRANLLSESEPFYLAHEAAAAKGDTKLPSIGASEKLGQHFVAFVKSKDGHLWELEGTRKGPLDRGTLGENDDVLSEKALKVGLERLMNIEREAGGDLRFSCIALAPSLG